MNKILIILFLICLFLSKLSIASNDNMAEASQFINIFDNLCKSNRDDLSKIESSDYLKHSIPFSEEMMRKNIKFIIDSK